MMKINFCNLKSFRRFNIFGKKSEIQQKLVKILEHIQYNEGVDFFSFLFFTVAQWLAVSV